jgi:hypothetical protein
MGYIRNLYFFRINCQCAQWRFFLTSLAEIHAQQSDGARFNQP